MTGKVFVMLLLATHFMAICMGAIYPNRDQPWHARVNHYNDHGSGLTVMEANEKQLQGEYSSSQGSIHFSSIAANGDHSITVTATNGKPIIVTRKPRRSSVLTMTIGDTKFVASQNIPGRGLPKYSDYVVPQAFHHHVEFGARQNHIPDAIMQYLDSQSANATRQEAVENIVSRGQADLIVEAAKALGGAGFMGPGNPAIQQFYALAMRLDKFKDRMMQQSQSTKSNDVLSPLRVKKQTCSGCTTGRCPYYGDQTRNCHGMCGRNCDCWSILCGDCCVHQGCLEHDDCCTKYGFWSFACLTPFGFSCSGYSC